MLAFLRIATLRRTGWKALITPFDILFGYPQSQNKLRYIDVLCGRMIFNMHFTGETSAVISSRGILGLCFLGAVFFYILLTVIFAPILETKYLPVKELRSDAPPLEMKDDVVWNIIPYIISLPKDDIDSDAILSSIDVASIWDSYTGGLSTLVCMSDNQQTDRPYS
ncbi:hypothetical protein GALMADRAFT_877981 [Galerina marginata CBS 339.88]|uniref:Uncharacterized protein n=1 Tax=Galerina marginata (strain CBS 339.88) TaxID=685588 RepID=A0A067SUW0_GALM3|nr:hypothetical protein GALMADRAFT_877981 [Galerina marginata CBS 339.88]